METHNVRETREQLSQLLDQVARGEQVTITRRGKPIAQLVPPIEHRIQFPSRRRLREAVPPATTAAADLVRQLRDEERF